ncbi:MAG: radical SAM protein [Chloroflexi bacterium]|nr:radical SAM protein [Chloroflexota bacterium]
MNPYITMSLRNIIKLGQLRVWQGACEQERREHPLRYLFWETTRRCNLACRHCGSLCSPAVTDADDLQADEVKAVLAQVAAAYDASAITLAVTGGEPLLRDDLLDVLGYAAGLGFAWGMVTNGQLTTPANARQAVTAGMRTVAVSVDGLVDTHDWLRGPGTHGPALAAARIYAGAGLHTTQITTCIGQWNVHQLEAMYEQAAQADVDEWRVLTISPIGRAREDQRLLLDGAGLRRVLDFVREKRRAGGRPRALFAEECFLGPAYEGDVRDSLFLCFAGVSVAGLLADGGIGACPNLPPHLAQGNIRQDDFVSVWETCYQAFREPQWKQNDTCGDCRYWAFCLGNGMHLWDWDAGRPMLCAVRALESSNANYDA